MNHPNRSQRESIESSRPKPGRPLLGKERRERYQIRLEPALAAWLDEFGNGNRSAGIEKAAIEAGYVQIPVK